MKLDVVAASALLILATCVQFSQCTKTTPSTTARKEDVPYIKCQVCEKLASQLYNQVQNKQAQISPKKISEYQIIEIAENVCNLKKEESDWILKIDIKEKGDKLELVEQDAEGHCNSECKTIEKACQEVIGYSDTDVAEYVYKHKPDIESLMKYLCHGLTDACRSNPPPVPKDRVPGEPFAPKPTKEAEMDKILRSMQGMPGAPGMKMYSREELEKNKNKMNSLGKEDDDEDEDEDEDEDDNFPKNLGKILGEKQSKGEDWKTKIAKEIKSKGEVLKKHANKVSNRVRRWWKGLRSSPSSPTKKTKTGNSEL